MTTALLLITLLLLASTIVSSRAASTILLAGDSHAEQSELILQDVCGGSKVANVGVGGSQAYEFATGDLVTGGCIDRPGLCSPQGVFTSEESDEVTSSSGKFSHTYLSLGGNDWLDNGCSYSIRDGVANNIRLAINGMLGASPNPGMKILMTGYSYLPDDIDDCPAGNLELLMEAVSTAVSACDDPSRVRFIDVMGIFGGSPSNPYSDKKYYDDAIHLNARGYKKLFRQPGVQSFFGCDGSEVDDDNNDNDNDNEEPSGDNDDEDDVSSSNDEESSSEDDNEGSDDEDASDDQNEGSGDESSSNDEDEVSPDDDEDDESDDEDDACEDAKTFPWKGKTKNCKKFVAKKIKKKGMKKACKKFGDFCPRMCGECLTRFL